MNRMLKKLSIFSLIAILAGIVLVILGVGLGGRMALAIDLGNKSVSTDQDKNVKMVEYSEKLDAFHSISIDTDVYDISLVEGGEYGISYCLPEKEKPKYTVSKDTLKLKSHAGGSYTQVNLIDLFPSGKRTDTRQNQIKITVPKHTLLKTVSAKLDASDLAMEQLQMQTLTLTSDTGDMKLTGISCEEYQIETDTGDIKMEQITAKTGQLTVDTGDVKMQSGSVDRFKLKTDTGDVKLGGMTLSSFEVQSETGDITVQDSSLEKGNLVSDTGDVKLLLHGNENEYAYDIGSDTGDVNVNGHKKDNVLIDAGQKNKIKARSDSGDITIRVQ